MTSLPIAGCCLGIDVGGTKTHGILLDPEGRRLAESLRATRTGTDGVIATIVDVIADCLGGENAQHVPLVVGVGIPGQVDPDAGIVRTAVNLGISELDLGPRLAALTGLPVTLENDVKAAALGAAHYLGDVGGDLAYLNFGTGVAAAAVVDGRLCRGDGNLAGEIGHFPVDPHGEVCQCGQRGCIEVLAGGGNIAARLAALGPGLALPHLAEAADAGDPRAVAEADRIASGIALAVQLMVLAHGSARVALGGGVVHTAPRLVARAQRLLDEWGTRSPFLASLRLSERVTILPAGHPVAVFGAALAGLEHTREPQPTLIG